MQVIVNDSSTVLRLFNSDEVRPLQGTNPSEVVKEITERYNFSVPPQIPTGEQAGISYKAGQIDINESKINITSMVTYSEGIAVNTCSTEQGILVIEDLVMWLGSRFKFRTAKTPYKTFFENSITVDFDVCLDSFIQLFMQIKDVYANALHSTYDVPFKIDFTNFGMGWDPHSLPNPIASFLRQNFVINRRIGIPFEANRYYCQAPLPTNRHIEVLQNFENIIKSL